MIVHKTALSTHQTHTTQLTRLYIVIDKRLRCTQHTRKATGFIFCYSHSHRRTQHWKTARTVRETQSAFIVCCLACVQEFWRLVDTILYTTNNYYNIISAMYVQHGTCSHTCLRLCLCLRLRLVASAFSDLIIMRDCDVCMTIQGHTEKQTGEKESARDMATISVMSFAKNSASFCTHHCLHILLYSLWTDVHVPHPQTHEHETTKKHSEIKVSVEIQVGETIIVSHTTKVD